MARRWTREDPAVQKAAAQLQAELRSPAMAEAFDASDIPDNAWQMTSAPYEAQDPDDLPWSSIEDFDRERDDRLTDEAR